MIGATKEIVYCFQMAEVNFIVHAIVSSTIPLINLSKFGHIITNSSNYFMITFSDYFQKDSNVLLRNLGLDCKQTYL